MKGTNVMKKMKFFSIVMGIVLLLSACKNPLQEKPKVNIDNVSWEMKMGINYLDDRAAMVEFCNNSDFTITELSLEFRMKENLPEDKLDEFYTYLKKEYNLSDDDVNEIRETGVSMNSHAYLDEDEYIEKGQKFEETLLYGIKFIRTLEYCDLFEPEMYRIEYIDDIGEEHTTYYDYLNNTYTEK